MNIFPRLSALFVLSVASVTLFGCSVPASASDDAETTAATTQPLFESFEGTGTADGLRIRDDRGASTVAVGEGFRGTLAFDPNAFVICSDQHCVQWQKSVGTSER